MTRLTAPVDSGWAPSLEQMLNCRNHESRLPAEIWYPATAAGKVQKFLCGEKNADGSIPPSSNHNWARVLRIHSALVFCYSKSRSLSCSSAMDSLNFRLVKSLFGGRSNFLSDSRALVCSKWSILVQNSEEKTCTTLWSTKRMFQDRSRLLDPERSRPGPLQVLGRLPGMWDLRC